MAAELVSGALLSGFINVFFERLVPQDVMLKLFRGKDYCAKLLNELKVKLWSANVLLNDAEEKQLTNKDVKKWLDELTDVIYRADFLMDKIDTEASRREREDESASAACAACKILSFISRSVRTFEKDVIGEVQVILENLDLLLGQTTHLGLKEGVPNRPLQRLPAPLVAKESDVCGRDPDKERIVELSLSDDATGKNLSVIPIVGLGGVGKTTLAQLVYRDNRVQQRFDLKVWVTVSEDFNVFQITKVILEKVTSQPCTISDLFELQSALNKAISGKKLFFVLDDVWNEDYGRWDGLKSAFESGAPGSKIIVTTRSKAVALTMSKVIMHELKLVKDEACWGIFKRHVFDDNEAPAELEEIGREIVKRCKGLPLAVKSLAGLLRSTSNPEEWREVLNSDIWQLQFQNNLNNKVLPALWLSYQFLPPCLKRCFAYCSIFPKDYQFGESDMKKIIWLWMAEGLLQPEPGKKIEEVGEKYLQILIVRSFFQYSSQDESTMEKPTFVMHDIVHDLAMCISSEFSFQLDDFDDLHVLTTKARHLSYRKGSATKMKGLTSPTKSLRTLLALPLSFCWEPMSKSFSNELFLKVGGCLRVLSLCGSSITELPESIGNMKYLRYLDLSGTEVKEIPDSICTLYNLQTLLLLECIQLAHLPTGLAALVNLRHLDIRRTYLKEIPDSICTLYNLQTLLLSECIQLAHLPTRLAALVNLRHLDIRGTPLKEMPHQMCKMKSLQRLSNFVLGKNDGRRIKELGEFPLLEGSLCISGLQNIVDVRDVLEANLKNKKFLSELILKWDGDFNNIDSRKEREVLEALQPHTDLKKLEITGYRGTRFPDWVGHESFCNMAEVELRWSRNVCMLPPLGKLPSLRRLEIDGLDGVVSIGNALCGSSSPTTNQPFRSLEVLCMWKMWSWEEWSFSRGRVGQEGMVFPCLKELILISCNKLIVGLPDCYLPPSLKLIHIDDCKEMVDVCPSTQKMMETNAFPSLNEMVVSDCPRLEWRLGMGFPSNLKELIICNCEKFWQNRMNWNLQSLLSLKSLSLRGIKEEVFPEEGLLPTTLTELEISHFENLKGLNGRAFQNLTSLQRLEIWRCKELECLPEEALSLSLSSLTIEECPLLRQRYQRGTGEDWPKIQHIPNIDIKHSSLFISFLEKGYLADWFWDLDIQLTRGKSVNLCLFFFGMS
ncbi:hypothetical protein UlMin_045028 [Ulmus minor]